MRRLRLPQHRTDRTARAPTGRSPQPDRAGQAPLGPACVEPLSREPVDQNEIAARRFFEIAEHGLVDHYHQVLADDVVYLVPGRGPSAGLHTGRQAVIAALSTEVADGVEIDSCRTTELMLGRDRAVGILLLEGRRSDLTHFGFEVAFHLQCDDGRITAITEYAGDQYTADELLRP